MYFYHCCWWWRHLWSCIGDYLSCPQILSFRRRRDRHRMELGRRELRSRCTKHLCLKWSPVEPWRCKTFPGIRVGISQQGNYKFVHVPFVISWKKEWKFTLWESCFLKHLKLYHSVMKSWPMVSTLEEVELKACLSSSILTGKPSKDSTIGAIESHWLLLMLLAQSSMLLSTELEGN